MQNFKFVLIAFFLYANAIFAHPPPLMNFGASCYVNALLQALYAAQPLTNSIANLQFDNFPANNYKKLVASFNSGNKTSITASLFDFYSSVKDMFAGGVIQPFFEEPFLDPTTLEGLTPEEQADIKKAMEESLKELQKHKNQAMRLARAIAQANNENFDALSAEEQKIRIHSIEEILAIFGSQPQQDAHEFLTGIIDKLRTDNTNSETYKIIENMFFYTTDKTPESIVNVPTYDSKQSIVNFTYEKNRFIFQVTEYKSLYHGLEKIFTFNPISKLPTVLILSLIRFINGKNIDTQEYRTLKTSHSIEVPFKLNMNSFVETNDNNSYELFAAVLHQGPSAQSGHYVAYVKNNNQWYLCNDERINPVSNQTAQTEINNDGYILFYQQAQVHIESPLVSLEKQLKELHNNLHTLYQAFS